MIWFSADFHLSHANIIKYCNRPFDSVEEMNATIVNNLIYTLEKGDTFYFLGDLTFNSKLIRPFFTLFKKIDIHFILGNHDGTLVQKYAKKYCKDVSYFKKIIIDEVSILLFHYALRTWDNDSWQLYGHSHGKLEPHEKQFDVGVDNNYFFPISFDELLKIMEK